MKALQTVGTASIWQVASYNEHTAALATASLLTPASSSMSSSFMSDIRSLLDNQELSDVTFVVEGTPVYAHKVGVRANGSSPSCLVIVLRVFG